MINEEEDHNMKSTNLHTHDAWVDLTEAIKPMVSRKREAEERVDNLEKSIRSATSHNLFT